MGNVKLGVCIWSLPYEEEVKWEKAAELGFDGIELDYSTDQSEKIPLSHPAVRTDLKNRASSFSLDFKTLGVNELCRTGMALKENQGKALDILKGAVEAALDLDCSILQVPSFGQGQIHNRSERDNTRECFRKICDFADGEKILISTENSLDAQGNLDLINEVNHPSFKIYFDTQNPHLFGVSSVANMIAPLFPHICEVHLKDGDRAFGNTLFGNGKAGVKETIKELEKHGYNGWYHFETDYRELLKSTDPKEDDLIRRDINAFREMIS